MGLIGTIFIGLIVGLVARFLKPGDDSMGWIWTILLGIGAPSPRPTAARPWASTRPARVPASSVPWSVPSSFW